MSLSGISGGGPIFPPGESRDENKFQQLILLIKELNEVLASSPFQQRDLEQANILVRKIQDEITELLKGHLSMYQSNRLKFIFSQFNVYSNTNSTEKGMEYYLLELLTYPNSTKYLSDARNLGSVIAQEAAEL